MITNKGKEIIGKFLLGQTNDFAGYIAGGSGATPVLSSASVAQSPNKLSLDFETFRIPITAKGFIKESDIEKIVLKAELPTSQRYLITEVGIFPAETNSLAGSSDSKIISGVIPEESWVYVVSGTSNLISFISSNIDADNLNANIGYPYNGSAAFFINSGQPIFSNEARQQRYEPPRFYDRVLLVNGNSASINSSFNISSNSTSIQTSALSLNLGQNLPDDEIKLAISLVSRDSLTGGRPDNIRIKMQLINNLPGNTTPPAASVNIDLVSADFASSRYKIISKKISDFTVDAGFNWSNINLIRFYISTLNSGATTDLYFIAIDGIRIDNVTTLNPIYGMVGYNVLKSSDALPIIKQPNTTSFIEYRFGIGVT